MSKYNYEIDPDLVLDTKIASTQGKLNALMMATKYFMLHSTDEHKKTAVPHLTQMLEILKAELYDLTVIKNNKQGVKQDE